jgi:predicted permease
MMNDLRFALRQLRKSPGFTSVAILTLSLGIGANTAIFSVVNAVLLKPLPFPAPQQLLAVGSINAQDSAGRNELKSISYPDYFDFRKDNRTLANIAVYRNEKMVVSNSDGVPQSLDDVRCSGDFFDVLGIKPILGRSFTRADEQAGGGPGGLKVILSHEFWQRHFGGDAKVIGQRIELNRQPFTIIGVMPARFQFPIQQDPPQFYVTIAGDAAPVGGSKPSTEQRGNHSLQGIARLKPGRTIGQAQADLSTIAARLAKEFPDTNNFFGVGVQPLREMMVGDVRTALYVLFGAVVCVLLIANANVANLLLARASARGKEIALRAALGAGRARIVRQLLTESILLSGLGGLLGLLLAQWGTGALVKVVPQNIPRIGSIQLDTVVLGFTLLVSLATGVIFGLVPAWQASHVDLHTSLKSGARTGSEGVNKGRLRNGLVMAEVALALVLLVCAGLLIETFARLGDVPTGLQPARLLTARIGLPVSVYPKNEDILAFYQKLIPKLRALPGVEDASTIIPLPLSSSNIMTDFDLAEHPLPEGQRLDAPIRIIGPDYFATAGIPLKQGRAFDEHDTMQAAAVVIVNERFAQKYFPGRSAIGQRITPGLSADNGKPKMREIVGVVGNVKYLSLGKEDMPEMYVPLTQIPFDIISLVVRTRVDNAASLTNAIQAQISSVDPDIPLTNVRVFEGYISRSLARPRFDALLLSIFAATALLLTAIGIYGVMAYTVAQRTNEIGIRIALGAAQSSIFRLIVGQAMTLVAISVVVGLLAAFAATRLLNSLLFGVGASDPITFGAIVLLIGTVAFLATWLPARRATQVDPIVALRCE